MVALYAELDDASLLLRQASESKTRFLANVSHELRTPVTSIIGLSQLLLDGSVGRQPPIELIRRRCLPRPAGPPVTTIQLDPGDRIVLVTDGLIERRRQHLDVSLDRRRLPVRLNLRTMGKPDGCDRWTIVVTSPRRTHT